MENFQNIKSPEKISIEEQTFRQYSDDLKLTPEDFNKVILDVGAGEAYFAKWAKDHNVSSSIYSLEPIQEMEMKEKVINSSAESIPMPDQSFDLIVSYAAIPNIYLGDKDAKIKVKDCFSEMLRVLRDGGEVRLARVFMGDKYENQRILASSIKEVLSELQRKDNIEITETRTPIFDSFEYDKHTMKGILAESFFVTIKKLKKENI